MKRRLRHIWSWKFVFYDVLLPPCARWDRRVGTGSWAASAGWRCCFSRGGGHGCAWRWGRASAVLEADWPVRAIWPALAANTARFVARGLSAR